MDENMDQGNAEETQQAGSMPPEQGDDMPIPDGQPVEDIPAEEDDEESSDDDTESEDEDEAV